MKLLSIISIFFGVISININQSEDVIPCEEIKLLCTQSKEGEYVIKNDSEYQNLLKIRSSHPDCKSYKLPEIDFNKYTLIGFVSSLGGCDTPEYFYNVTKDDNMYSFNISINQKGLCKSHHSIEIWCLIPKISDISTLKYNIADSLISK